MRVSYVTWTWGERLSTKYNAHTLAVGWRGVGARCPLMYKPARADQSRSARAQAPPLRGLMLPAVMGSNRKIGVSEGLEQDRGQHMRRGSGGRIEPRACRTGDGGGCKRHSLINGLLVEWAGQDCLGVGGDRWRVAIERHDRFVKQVAAHRDG